MKKILIPTDRSQNADHALDYALHLFKGQEVEFVLFQSFEVPTYTTDISYPIDMIGMEELGRVLEEYAVKLREAHASTKFLFSALVEVGSLSINVDELVSRSGIDMVVMGTKGASGLAAALIGSNTADVIQHACCPVLAVPADASIRVPGQILFASDNRGLSDPEVLRPMLDMAQRFGSHVHLMNVLDEGKLTTVDEAVEGLRLDHLLEGIPNTFHFEEGDDKAEAIEQYLNAHQIDMLAVVPRRNSFFDSIFHRSVTRKLALHTKVPLLAMHDLGD